ncbi:hypothetical protein BDV96DRAFT_657698 [Lophiotrema nucula]|uniref:SRR1-like domain-containing protein n=1 Tax=Lophiotrema nucula TaxID=690887 RepID=A0A6A5ZAL5_9PLEO|nr:hypothetical protein BDV96DRAFT_657698 [Lophiotrema nucula]
MNPEANVQEEDSPQNQEMESSDSGESWEIKYPNEPSQDFNGAQTVWTSARFEDILKRAKDWRKKNNQSLVIHWNSVKKIEQIYMDVNVKDEEVFAIFRNRQEIRNEHTAQTTMRVLFQQLATKWKDDPVSAKIKHLLPAQFEGRPPIKKILCLGAGPIREKNVDDPWYRHVAVKQILDALLEATNHHIFLYMQDGNYKTLDVRVLTSMMRGTESRVSMKFFQEPEGLAEIDSETLVIAWAHNQPIRQVVHQLTAPKERTPCGIICVPAGTSAPGDEHLEENTDDFLGLYESWNISKDEYHPLERCTLYLWPRSENPEDLNNLNHASPMDTD